MKYKDLNGCSCELFFEQGQAKVPSRHVLVIGKWGGRWLLTKHRVRGLEFPGGKAEPGESLDQAALRETHEETGASVAKLEWLAEYTVYAKQPFTKTVFVAEIDGIAPARQLETEGPVLVETLALDADFSFLMRDAGMETIIKKVTEHGKCND